MAHAKRIMYSEVGSAREWDYVPFSDQEVVRRLLQGKYALSHEYLALERSGLAAYGPNAFSEQTLYTYLSLDDLIDKLKLSARTRWILEMVMKGYRPIDLYERYQIDVNLVRGTITRVVRGIVKLNNSVWEDWVKKKFSKKNTEIDL